jgi:hypothetical protein
MWAPAREMKILAWLRREGEIDLGIEPRIEIGLALASECLPAVELAGSAVPPPLWWSTPGQFWRAPGKLVFGPSGRRKPTGPEQRASQSALGVLQLAYFSMRYGLLPGVRVRRILSKIVPRGLPRVNAEKKLLRLLSAPDLIVAEMILDRRVLGKGLKESSN